MRPRTWARRERKSDPRVLRIDQDDQRVRVRIVPQSLYAECFGWAACVPSTRSTLPTQVPICPASGSTQLNPGHRRTCPVPTEKPPRCCDEASFPANVGCLWSLAPGLRLGSGSTLLASPSARATAALTADERATLLQYAKDTWQSLERLTLLSGLPADSLSA